METPVKPPRVVAGIQARTSSRRLPRKVLADVAGAPLLMRVVERVRAARLVDRVLVLTSSEPADDELCELCEREGVAWRRGPLGDVLGRYGALLAEFEPEHVVRVTGDCPLVDPAFIDRQLEALRAFHGDYVEIAGGNDGLEGVLGGQTAYSARALGAAQACEDPLDREHVASFWFRRHPERFRIVELLVDESLRRPGLRLCVDEPADLELVRAIFAAHAPRWGSLVPLPEVLTWLERHPEVAGGNALVQESAANRELRGLVRTRRARPVGVWR